MKSSIFHKRIWIMVAMLISSATGYAQSATIDNVEPILDLSLEQLMNIEVTSMMKTSTRLSDTPGAVYVLTNEDIRRSGATTIPEALRNVPGLHVARIDTNKWAITARGFNGMLSNKLLVLVDGRSIYSPFSSGVWWDQQDVMMEDIDRIELIRGPGASLWGANAVNGVINITTKSAKNTQGGLVSAHAGDGRGGAGLRYGAKVGDDAYLKAYARTAMHSGENETGTNMDAGDLGRLHRAGFRFEKDVGSDDNLTLQGDIFNGDSGGANQIFPIVTASLIPVLAPPYAKDYSTTQAFKGYSLLGRWEHKQSADSNTSLQVYWDSHQRDSVSFNAVNRVDTFDVDFQHNSKLTQQQHVVWGLGYRRNMNDTSNGNILVFNQPKRSDDLYSLFIQDDITLQPQRWKLTLGSRFEHNPSTGLELQPSARLLWTPNEQQSLWASISRAVRTPSWSDEDVALSEQTIPPVGGGAASPFNPAVIVGIVGNKKIVSEKLMAYEAGWRGVLKHGMTADVALYYYDYDDLVTTNPNALDFTNIGSGYLLQTISFASGAKAKTYGGEIGLDWQLLDSWKLRASYAHFESDFSLKSNFPVGSGITFKNSYPRHQAMLWSQHQVNSNVNLDLNLRYVDGIKDTAPISSYTAFDARVAWNPNRNLELALVGRNLLDGKHAEFGKHLFFSSSEMPRELFVTARYHF